MIGRVGLLVCVLLAVMGILLPGIASASTCGRAENRTLGIDVVVPLVFMTRASSTAEHHRGSAHPRSDLPSCASLAAEGESSLAGRMRVERDDFSVQVRVDGDPKAWVRIEADGNVLKVTDLYRGPDLPPGSGSEILARGLAEAGVQPGQTIVAPIINEPSIAAFEAGLAPEASVVGRSATRAFDSLGLSVTDVRWEVIRGRVCIVGTVK